MKKKEKEIIIQKDNIANYSKFRQDSFGNVYVANLY